MLWVFRQDAGQYERWTAEDTEIGLSVSADTRETAIALFEQAKIEDAAFLRCPEKMRNN